MDYLDNLVQFNVKKIKNSNVIWRNQSGGEFFLNNEVMINQFGYANEDCPTFRNMEFVNDSKLVNAERYGCDTHYGAARCGNFGEYHVKGLGITPLLIDGNDEHHSCGSLNMQDAVLEIIFSEVVEKLLPFGATKCYGLISTGEKTARWYSDKHKKNFFGFGALLIREGAIRPSHFLRAYVPSEYDYTKNGMISDVERVRRVNVELYRRLGGEKEFMLSVGVFLRKCAIQFSSSKFNRFGHFGLTFSNLCLDSRWIDLTLSSFADTRKNYVWNTIAPGLYDEKEVPLSIAHELIYTFAKYNKIHLNSSPFEQYYAQQLLDNEPRCLTDIIGLRPTVSSKILVSNEVSNLVRSFNELFPPNHEQAIFCPINGQYQYEIELDDDPVVIWLESLYRGLGHARVVDNQKIIDNFKFLIDIAYRESYAQIYDFKSYVISVVISGLRRAYFSSFFNRWRIFPLITQIQESGNVNEYTNFLSTNIDVVDWLFELNLDCQYLFKSEGISLSYILKKSCYVLMVGDEENSFRSSKDVRKFCMESVSKDSFFIQSYDFNKGLNRMLSILSNIES